MEKDKYVSELKSLIVRNTVNEVHDTSHELERTPAVHSSGDTSFQRGTNPHPKGDKTRDLYSGNRMDNKTITPEVTSYLFDYPNRGLLTFGLNYSSKSYSLRGPENDSKLLSTSLKTKLNYNVRLINDKNVKSAGILESISTFLRIPSTRHFIHYSGHGGSRKDGTDKDEIDGKDEFIVGPGSLIVDDSLYATIKNNIGIGNYTFILMDCCNSGSVIDLKYQYEPSYAGREIDYRIMTNRSTNIPGSSVIMISGCADDQTSIEFNTSSGVQGLLTLKFRELFETNIWRTTTWKQFHAMLLVRMKGYIQKPVLSSNDYNLFDQLVIF